MVQVFCPSLASVSAAEEGLGIDLVATDLGMGEGEVQSQSRPSPRFSDPRRPRGQADPADMPQSVASRYGPSPIWLRRYGPRYWSIWPSQLDYMAQ